MTRTPSNHHRALPLPPFDKGRMLFGAAAFDVADRVYAGSFGGDAGGAFLDALYREFQAHENALGRGAKAKAWLKTRLETAFPCVTTLPKWLDEPEWPYHLGSPMVFLGQLTVPATPVAQALAASGDEVYVFTAREYEENTRDWRIVYATVSQSRAFLGAGVVSTRRPLNRRRARHSSVRAD